MLKPLLADNTAIELIFEDTHELPELRTDEGKVSQILRNLISNALKFTPEGKVVVTARMTSPRDVEFTVADTGIGIAPEHHETIFKEFSQVENPLQERHRGTGLGLPLCRNLAALLGGAIWLESEPGRGSTFYVQIPAVYIGDAARSGDTASLPAPEFHGAPVLIVEDDAETAAVFESHLRATEFQPIITSSLAHAEEWVAKHMPAAVLADVCIGDESVWTLVARWRDKWPHLPILATSVSAEAENAATWGANHFLPKPVQRGELLEILRSLTGQTGTRRILMVDDNEVSRYILRDLLNVPWLEVREASNGNGALAAIAEQPPDALILDLLMPDISGFEILRRLRSQPATRDLPVLVYTSKALTEAEKAQLNACGAGVIRKEDVSARLSAQPFLDWIRSIGLALESTAQVPNA